MAPADRLWGSDILITKNSILDSPTREELVREEDYCGT